MISLKTLKAAWDRFFFEPISPLPIAVYRILLGSILFLNQILLLPDVNTWFGSTGVLSFETALQVSGGTGFNLFSWLPHNAAAVWFVYLLSCFLSVSLALGFFTRTSAILLYLVVVTLHHRNPLILHGGDTFLRIAIFFLIFSPAGAALSLDRYFRIRSGKETGALRLYSPWAMRLLQLQLSFLYLYAFVWKVSGTMWLSGTAVYFTSRLLEFWRFPLPYIFEHMWTIKLWTWSTILIEFSLGTLIWIKELRYSVLIAGVLLHVGIDYTMNIPLFGFVMVSAYVLFIEPPDLARFMDWAKIQFYKRFPSRAPSRAPEFVSAEK